jgi:Mn-dependent DtxR family transcriptional regulator
MLLESITSTESQQYVQNRLKHLRENNLVHRPGRGIYELTPRGKKAVVNLHQYDGNRNSFWERVTGGTSGNE